MENRSGLDFSSCKVPSVMRMLALPYSCEGANSTCAWVFGSR